MFERHPVMAALLDTACVARMLLRHWVPAARAYDTASRLHPERVEAAAFRAGCGLSRSDISVPAEKPLVKKKMRVFQLLGCRWGYRRAASARASAGAGRAPVVVKRPDYAAMLARVAAHVSITTKNYCFDLYPLPDGTPPIKS